MLKVNSRFILTNVLARNLFKYTDSYFETSKVLFPLESRTVINVSGPEAPQFLQGLITNDMNHFKDGALTMYTMFLNNKGRVLYDTLIHKWGDDNTFMLECDKSVHDLLQKHLRVYKLRRDVKIGDICNYFKVWALIAPPNTELEYTTLDAPGDINIYKDPRLQDLGYRLITSTQVDQFDLLDALGKDTVIENCERGYQTLKYKLGVGEGAEDMFPGACLPLEANCDYLHGVSFHKGCYIGQELTARVYHTGVVRKRFMPLKFLSTEKTEDLERDAPIWAHIDPGRKNIGKLKRYMDGYGLGLVRIQDALAAKELVIGVNPIEITKPAWWPIEATKEKFSVTNPDSDNLSIAENTPTNINV